jgi:hypothetical protein
VEHAGDEISSIALTWSVPDVEMFPPDLHKVPMVLVAGVYSGNAETGMQVMHPLRELGTPLLDLSHIGTYTELQQAFDSFFPVGDLYYWTSMYIDTLGDAAIDAVMARAAVRPSDRSDCILWHLGGAIARVSDRDTAFGRRSAPYLLTAESTWTDATANDRNIAWARETLDALRQWSHGGLYLNFAGLGEGKDALVRSAYGPNYDRLVELKGRYDPTNLFRMNLNITPA